MSKKKKISYFVGAIVLIVGIGIGWGLAEGVHYTESPEFCDLCHVMDPFTASWEESPHHGRARCYDCHADPGFVGFVNAKARGAQELYSFVATDITAEDIKGSLEEIPERRCENCHEEVHDPEDFSDRIFPEESESADEIPSCRNCHTEMGHLELSEEEQEAYSGYYASWTDSEFLVNHHADANVTCSACHGSSYPEEAASTESCEACHGGYDVQAELTSDVSPNPHDSHLGEVDCTVCHKSHQESTLYCNQCHEYDLQMPQQVNFENTSSS